MRAELILHPTSPTSPVAHIEVEVQRLGEDGLKLVYRLSGDLDRLRFPGPAEMAFTDELWKHTCLEAFVRAVGRDDYLEMNFSPSLQWASYRFNDYRRGMRPANVSPSSLQGRLGPPFAFEAVVAPGRMARPDLPAPIWKLALAAVIEADDGTLSYWALAHPSAKPDFHHPDSFVLELP